ncbi:nucleoside deaminase [Legionella sp. CNM-1927-20]|uniref:nucleoside deaminase n=1 Tax=Legionella sp. CNM-1927-20 TaxID=3422221 RepID=UPI00403A82B3
MDFIKRTIALAQENVEHGGRPFACLIIRHGKVLAEAPNTVAQTHDPTAHAEINAIRIATAKLGCEHLYDCEFYILAHPCPMCLAAMYYCSPKKVIFITTREEYKTFYKDDRKYFTLENFYEEINKPWAERTMPMEHQPNPDAIRVYQLHQEKARSKSG